MKVEGVGGGVRSKETADETNKDRGCARQSWIRGGVANEADKERRCKAAGLGRRQPT